MRFELHEDRLKLLPIIIASKPWWCEYPADAKAHCHRDKHLHLAQELATEGESWGRWIATYSNEVSQQISNKV